MQKKIIHVDMDAFFVSVELRDKPELQHLPVAVGGDSSRRGVISTCNYVARQYGIHSAMPTAIAKKKCPELILLPGQMALYKNISRQIKSIFFQFTDLVEPLSLDEAYLDVTASELVQGSATLTAEKIRQKIFQQTGLTASAGIAENKFLAKIASDINKPNGQFTVHPKDAIRFIKNLPLKKIHGVGKVTAEKLAAYGLQLGGDIQNLSADWMQEKFGRFGILLWQRCQGIDNRAVEPSRIRKSVGVETTFGKDINISTQGSEQLKQILLTRLLPELNNRLSAHHKRDKYSSKQNINRLTVKVKFSDFKQTTKDCRASHIDSERFIILLTQALNRAAGRSVRLLGLQVGLCDHQETVLQLDLPI
nr:DNA polymerase IV [Gayadomonas joobiniege]